MIFATGNAWSQATKGKKRNFDFLQHVTTSQIIATMLWDREVSRISVIYVQGNLTITFPPERNKKLSLGSHDVAKPFGVLWPLADVQIKKSQKCLSSQSITHDPNGFLGFVRLPADNMLSPKRGTISCSAFSGKMGLVGEVKLNTLTLLLQWDVLKLLKY